MKVLRRIAWSMTLVALVCLSSSVGPMPARAAPAIPLFRQEHPLSCEAAALRMALGALGIQATEDDVLARLPVDPTPRQVAPDGTVTWGDPDIGFVGQWDGVFARDGYGVYQEPIAAVARSFGLAEAVGLAGADPADLYAAAQSTPVVVWMPYGGTVNGRDWWQTPDGKRVDYVITEHAVVLAGLDGDQVTYADPYTGTFQTLPRDRFEAALAELGDRAVVLRP